MFIAMVALKFSRQSYNFKEDNLLDAVAYIGAWQNYINDTKPDHAGPDLPEEVSSTKEWESPLSDDDDTQDAPISVAQNPYTSATPSQRSLINALTNLREAK